MENQKLGICDVEEGTKFLRDDFTWTAPTFNIPELGEIKSELQTLRQEVTELKQMVHGLVMDKLLANTRL